MAAFTSIALAVAVVGTAMSYQQQRKAQALQKEAAGEQKKANAIQSATQTEQAAAERRNQVRQERIKRAAILQQAENTGTAESSGEMGATGGMSTMLASNLGANQAAIGAGQAITGFNQAAANFNTRAQSASNRAGLYSQIAGLGSTMFSASGGFRNANVTTTAPAGLTNQFG